jgi:hypothetical protein
MVYTIDNSLTGINWNLTGANLTVQNAINIIRTFKYEIAYLRTLGITQSLLDQPISKIKGKLATEIIDQIKLYYPDINIVSVDISQADYSGNLQIKVVIDI